MNNPLVSVILPTFNRETYILEAINSVLDQTLLNFELIIVDDGSTDSTCSILKKIEDERVICIYQDNRGRSAARNNAIRHCRGKYIAFLDSDDLYLPDKLLTQARFLDLNPSIGMVYTDAACINEAGKPIYNFIYKASVSGMIYADIAFFLPVTITLPSVMMRREVLEVSGYFDEYMERFEDTDLWRRVAKKFQIAAMPTVTVKVRTHSDNTLSSQNPKAIISSIDYYLGKISNEDKDISLLVRTAGASRLLRYYSNAFSSLPEFKAYAQALDLRASQAFQPLVSIIIPVYNGSAFLEEAIESSLMQTYENFEVIVVNDGSSDGGASAQVAARYGDKIRYYEKSNGGVASALNYAIDRMNGEFFSWLSHDDVYEPSKLQMQVKALAEQTDPSKCIMYSDYTVFSSNPHNEYAVSLAAPKPENFRLFITEYNTLHGCTLLVPRHAYLEYGGFNPQLQTTQDYDFWYRIASSYRFIHQPHQFVKARKHANQGSVVMSDIASRECNDLLTGFVSGLTEDELLATGAPSVAEAYYLLCLNLEGRGFLAASESAENLSRKHGFTVPSRQLSQIIVLRKWQQISKFILRGHGFISLSPLKKLARAFSRSYLGRSLRRFKRWCIELIV
jgi:glycosyltransferase involved in cell wall biosynthesis